MNCKDNETEPTHFYLSFNIDSHAENIRDPQEGGVCHVEAEYFIPAYGKNTVRMS
ncbi:hypothetical protein [Rodentibacter myodis]|uniref:hypothetical protein n=1 Tax=Rodentibacter myodis TaxID=1907939 RepID=UPI001FC966FE|nr:hypothetical protein [Rodentibacter myodis]